MTRSGIVAGGCWIVDRIKVIDHFPAPGTLVSILSESKQNGGAPFNLLVDLARLGAPFPLAGVGLLGEDEDGCFVREQCQAHGIDMSQLRIISDVRTAYTDVMADQSSGQRTFFHHHGANASLSPEHFDFSELGARHLHLGYLLLMQTLDHADPEFGTGAARVLASAKSAGLSTSIDVVSEDSNRFESIVLPSLPFADIAFMNEFELARTTGADIQQDSLIKDIARACGRLFQCGLKGLAVIHTASQAVACHPDGSVVHRPSASNVQIVGTVGAGDAFAAGFLLAWHEEKQITECLRYAIAAAASSLCGEGASNAVLPIAEALARFTP